MRLFLVPLMLLLSACVTQSARELPPAPPQPGGEFARLPIQETQRMIDRLSQGDYQAEREVLTDPNRYTPPVLFALANHLFQQGEDEAAVFWFYTAQLRARSDANKSLDPTTARGVTALSAQFGRGIATFARQHPEVVQAMMPRVLAWDAKVQRRYDPRWVALQGQDAQSQTRIAFTPPERWADIDATTREGFRQGFERAMSGQ